MNEKQTVEGAMVTAREGRKAFDKKALNSKKTKLIWNLLIIQRLEKLFEKRGAYLKKRNIFNVVDLLRRMQVEERYIGATLIGTYDLRLRHRQNLGDLFDDNASKREILSREIKQLTRDVAMLENSKVENFGQLEDLSENIQYTRDLKKQAQSSLELLPTRNTVDPSLWRYPTIADLKRKNFIEIRKGSTGTKFYDLTALGLSIMDTSRGISKLASGEDLPGDDLLLDLWGRMRVPLKGSLTVGTMFQRLLGRA